MNTATHEINLNFFSTGITILKVCLVTGLFVLLSACRSGPTPAQCIANTGTYQQAQNNPPLKIPAGAETPDRRNALNIPEDNGKAVEKNRCLEVAPNYFGIAARIAASPEEMVADWAQAWADRNSDIVMSMYATTFVADSATLKADWLTQRSTDIKQSPLPSPRVSELKVSQVGDDQRLATFTQQFGKTIVRKELTLIRESGLWKISRERVVATP
jgi:hypothetical protein